MTDFVGGIQYLIGDTTEIIETIIRPSFEFDHFDLQQQLLIFRTYQIIADDKDVETTIGEPIKNEEEQVMIYIYNTHQNEKYLDGKTVVDASLYLAQLLEQKGCKVKEKNSQIVHYALKGTAFAMWK